MKRLVRNLRDNSIEAFVLALETINRPSVRYRMEAFCFLFCNSWELLMKAKLLNDGQKIYYRKKYKQPRRSLSLDDCLNRVFTGADNPVRLNIETIHELRNNATHLIVPFVPPGIMGLFQAGVINYPRILQEWFGINLSDRVPLGMMALVYDFSPEQHSLQHARMTRRLSSETVQWLTEFQQDVSNRANSLGENSQRFYVPIDLSLAIIRNPAKAEVVLSSGAMGTEALVMHVSRNPDVTHPYRQKEVLEMLNKRLGEMQTPNSHDIRCIKKVYKIDGRPDFLYKPKFHSPQYSPQFVDWLYALASKTPDFFARTRRRANIKTKKRKGK